MSGERRNRTFVRGSLVNLGANVQLNMLMNISGGPGFKYSTDLENNLTKLRIDITGFEELKGACEMRERILHIRI